jgi:hypothetical protein
MSHSKDLQKQVLKDVRAITHQPSYRRFAAKVVEIEASWWAAWGREQRETPVKYRLAVLTLEDINLLFGDGI